MTWALYNIAIPDYSLWSNTVCKDSLNYTLCVCDITSRRVLPGVRLTDQLSSQPPWWIVPTGGLGGHC